MEIEQNSDKLGLTTEDVQTTKYIQENQLYVKQCDFKDLKSQQNLDCNSQLKTYEQYFRINLEQKMIENQQPKNQRVSYSLIRFEQNNSEIFSNLFNKKILVKQPIQIQQKVGIEKQYQQKKISGSKLHNSKQFLEQQNPQLFSEQQQQYNVKIEEELYQHQPQLTNNSKNQQYYQINQEKYIYQSPFQISNNNHKTEYQEQKEHTIIQNQQQSNILKKIKKVKKPLEEKINKQKQQPQKKSLDINNGQSYKAPPTKNIPKTYISAILKYIDSFQVKKFLQGYIENQKAIIKKQIQQQQIIIAQNSENNINLGEIKIITNKWTDISYEKVQRFLEKMKKSPKICNMRYCCSDFMHENNEELQILAGIVRKCFYKFLREEKNAYFFNHKKIIKKSETMKFHRNIQCLLHAPEKFEKIRNAYGLEEM